MEVSPIIYTYKSDDAETKKDINTGFFAQDVRDCLIRNNIGYRSYLVMYDEDDNTVYDPKADEEHIKYGLDYSKFVPTLWKGWQMHEQEISELKAELRDLKEIFKNAVK